MSMCRSVFGFRDLGTTLVKAQIWFFFSGELEIIVDGESSLWTPGREEISIRVFSGKYIFFNRAGTIRVIKLKTH